MICGYILLGSFYVSKGLIGSDPTCYPVKSGI